MENLKKLLNGFEFKDVVIQIASIKNKKGEYVNRWLWNKPLEYFKKIDADLKKLDIKLDGKHATLTQRGLTFDYIIYKNRLLKNYPKAIIDLDLVFKGDTFTIKKENGCVIYDHSISNPFDKKLDKLIGGYCIVRIPNRGEFQTTMGFDELEKHKKLSNMQYLYNDWWQELYKKTLLRKNLKFHLEDEFEDIQKIDDEGMDNDFSKSKALSEEEIKQLADKAKTYDQLTEVWKQLTDEQQQIHRDFFNNKHKNLKKQ